MAISKSKESIWDRADNLLKTFYHYSIIHQKLLNTDEMYVLNILVKTNLVTPYILDDYKITSKGKFVCEQGGTKKILQEYRIKNHEARIAKIMWLFNTIKNSIVTSISWFFNNAWVRGIGVGIILIYISANQDLINNFLDDIMNYLKNLFVS